MKIFDLVLPLKVILSCTFIIILDAGCEKNQEQIKTNFLPASAEKKINKNPIPHPIPPDTILFPDTVESHNRIQKKPEIRTYRRTINFHKRPLIT